MTHKLSNELNMKANLPVVEFVSSWIFGAAGVLGSSSPREVGARYLEVGASQYMSHVSSYKDMAYRVRPWGKVEMYGAS